jgi:hypothetical protein
VFVDQGLQFGHIRGRSLGPRLDADVAVSGLDERGYTPTSRKELVDDSSLDIFGHVLVYANGRGL